MVFLDQGEYWTKQFPVIPVLRGLFGDRFDEVVTIASDADAAIAAIVARAPDIAKWAATAVDRKLRP
jgi:hypothetical protein